MVYPPIIVGNYGDGVVYLLKQVAIYGYRLSVPSIYGDVHMALNDGDIIRVAARILWNLGSDIVNVWYCRIDDANSLDLDDSLDDVGEWIEDIYDNFSGNMANNATFEDISVSNVTQDLSYGARSWPTLTVGGGSGDALSPGYGIFVYFPTTTPGVQGRKWFAPFTETVHLDGVWDGTLLTGIAGGLADGVLASFLGTNGTLLTAVIPHLVSGGVALDPPVYIPYTEASISNNPGYQRRRRPGFGS